MGKVKRGVAGDLERSRQPGAQGLVALSPSSSYRSWGLEDGELQASSTELAGSSWGSGTCEVEAGCESQATPPPLHLLPQLEGWREALGWLSPAPAEL